MRRYDEKRWRVEVRVVCTSLEEILGGLGRGLGEIYSATSRKGSPGSGFAMLEGKSNNLAGINYVHIVMSDI